MQYLATLGSRQFEVISDQILTQEQVNTYAVQKLGCSSCGSAKSEIPRLGTATCGGPYVQNSTHTLTGTIVSGGTAPFTYTWTITPPTGSPINLTGPTQSYTFSQSGIYNVALSVRDSCPSGGLTDSASCNVTVTPTCPQPGCNISIV